jgi:cyclopropane fatty-acyl-phospholipid synthase-like methyltransferase
MADYTKFQGLTFDKFRALAQDDKLSRYEKIGFPDSYRQDSEEAIFEDVVAKLSNLRLSGKNVMEIGPGCSELPLMLMDLCLSQGHTLVLIDSQEMLDLLPDQNNVEKLPGFYPNLPELFERFKGKVDVILAYSVIQYVFTESNLWAFLDRSLELLAPGGQILLGDIPNMSKRKRFFAGETGVEFHKRFMNTDVPPEVIFNQIEHEQMDDAVVLSLIQRARLQGFDAYILPQAPGCPMANRREDILIVRP